MMKVFLGITVKGRVMNLEKIPKRGLIVAIRFVFSFDYLLPKLSPLQSYLSSFGVLLGCTEAN